MGIIIKGSICPDIILIEPEMSENDHKYLSAMLEAKGINDNNCKTIIFDEKIIFPMDYQYSIEEISSIINKDEPKLIITVGGNLSALFIENFTCITECHGIIYKRLFETKEFMVMPFYHPAYLIRNNANIDLRESFRNDIQKIILVCTGEISDSVASSTASANTIQVHDFEDETYICLTYDEFDRFCKDQIDNFELIAYDIETNAREKTSKDYKVVGFSLASNSKKGCYVVLYSLDYIMSTDDQKLVEKRLTEILLNKRILIYNYMHEELATLNWLGIEMPNVDDLFTTVKLLMGNAGEYEGNGGLKIQCEMNLNTADWSKDLDTYMEFFKNFSKEQESMRSILNKYYDSEEIDNLLGLIEEQAANSNNYVVQSKKTIISYGVVPYKLIGKYGGIDSSILFDLLDFYKKRIAELNSELGIDLNIGYEHWMNHHYAGYILERNGAFFNDEKASATEKWCVEGMEESLREMIRSELSEPYIKDKIYWEFLTYLKDTRIGEILGVFATPKRMYKSSIRVMLNEFYDNPLTEEFRRMSMIPDSKGLYKLELGHIETLAKRRLSNFDEIFNSWYESYMRNFNAVKHTVPEMKELLNPTATGEPWKKFLTSILISDDIKYAKFFRIMISVIESPDFSMDRYYGEDDKKLLELVIKLKDLDMPDKNKFDIFMKFFKVSRTIKSKYLNRKISEALSYSIDSTNEDYILELYDFYVLNGIDIEDRSTWTENFRFLYNFRRYKKFSKIITTYINGKVGRNSVWYVDQEAYSRGDKFTPRLFKYYDRENHDLKGKVPILQSNFMVDFADTGRWTASMHTIPSADTTKGIFTSRFKGGVIAMPDCSQAEIRVLAAVSQDENLMAAFQKEGTDIHKYVASLVFCNGDIDAVTKTQRKIAKGAVFGILYGESIESFAESFTHGDLEEAKKIFDFFYTAFPRIKDYVEDSHNQFNTTSKVALRMMNRFIDLAPIVIENGGDTNKALRQSQNYIIQGQTCDVAGLILYQVCKYIRDHNLKSKPFCFIHDSIEIDLHPDETFLMLDVLKPLFNEYPMKTFGIPMASDIVFSSNMGAEIDSHIQEHDDEYNDVTIKMDGYEDDILEVIKNWKEVYDRVELVSQEDGEEKYVPFSGMFQKKVVISKLMGTTRKEISCVYHVIRKEK